MHFETAGSAPFILTGVKDGPSFRDRVLQQRDSLSDIASSGQTTQSNDVLVEIRDLLQQINENLSSEE